MGAPVRGLRVWGLPSLLLVAILLGPLALLRTPLAPLAVTWLTLIILAGWFFAVASFIGALARVSTPPVMLLERGVRRWVALFAPDPEALWLHWARHAHHVGNIGWCLARAGERGGAEALFQEGLLYLEGGLGPGGQISGTTRMAQAAERGHPEAAFRYAEALRTGLGTAVDPAAAERWYRRSAQGGFGRAAAWLARAYEVGDGVVPDAEAAQRYAAQAARLAPHPPLSRSLTRHDAAPEDPLVRLGGRALAGAEAVAAEVMSRCAGRWLLVTGALVLATFLLMTVFVFFWAGSSGLYHLPLIVLAVPLAMLGWQAWRLRREGPRRGRDPHRRAAEAGDPEACYRLGLACQKGQPGHPRDDLGAVLWFRRAAEAGHRGAMRALAAAYRGGHGVPRDPRRAAQWEALAAEPDGQLPAAPAR